MTRVCDCDPSEPPPAKSPAHPNPTTIHSLTEDLLLVILLRLPSLGALIRAAHTCRAWRRAVASSQAFRRRFRELHPAPLLGLFFETPGVVKAPAVPTFPTFTPARRGDRDLTAVVRCGDFFLTSIEERPGGPHGWDILDCRGGYLLLVNYEEDLLAVFNPLVRRSERFFRRCHADTLRDHRGTEPVECDARLLCSDEEPMSFRVVLIAYDLPGVRATVFSSDTGEWSILTWVDVLAKPSDQQSWLVDKAMHSDGFLHWFHKNCREMINLNTATMEFSVDKLPRLLRHRYCSFAVCDTKSVTRCIVYAVNFKVGLYSWTTESNGTGCWALQWTASLDTQLRQVLGRLSRNYNMLQALAVRDGFVYLATSLNLSEPGHPCWFLSFCLETRKLEKLFERANDSYMHPYVMAWPPSLVGNHGRFALEHGCI